MQMIRCTISDLARTESNASQSGKQVRELSSRALCEVRDQNAARLLSQQKCVPLRLSDQILRSGSQLSTKRAPFPKSTANKQNDPLVPLADGTAPNLLALASRKLFLDRGGCIERERGEVAALRECVGNIGNNQKLWREEEERRRREEIIKLKVFEREQADNLREFQGMKDNLQDIRRKYESVLSQKNQLAQKYSSLLSENQDLTVLINGLKYDLQETARSQAPALAASQEDILRLRQELARTESKAEACEVRSLAFERRMTEYMAKYNEAQGGNSENQLRYFKVQKENDELREAREELRRQLDRLGSQRQGEKAESDEELRRLRERLQRQEEEEFELIQEKEGHILQLEGELVHLEDVVQQNQSVESQIALKITRVQGQIARGNDYLNTQNETLHSENRSLSDIITLHERKIWELTSKNTELVQTIAKQRGASERQQSLSESNYDALEKEKRRLQSQVRRVREQQGQQKRYYREKYERELEEYSILSRQFSGLEGSNCTLLRTGAVNSVEMGRLKAEVVMLRSEIERVLTEEEGRASRVGPEPEGRELKEAFRVIGRLQDEEGQLREHLARSRAELQGSKQEVTGMSQALHFLKQEKIQGQQKMSQLFEVLALKQAQIQQIRGQLELQVQDVRELTRAVTLSEHKYCSLVQQYTLEVAEYESQKAELMICPSSSGKGRRGLLSSQVSVASELGSATVDILRRENAELQRVLGAEIERRNVTIRELIREKKCLFEQLVERGFP